MNIELRIHELENAVNQMGDMLGRQAQVIAKLQRQIGERKQ